MAASGEAISAGADPVYADDKPDAPQEEPSSWAREMPWMTGVLRVDSSSSTKAMVKRTVTGVAGRSMLGGGCACASACAPRGAGRWRLVESWPGDYQRKCAEAVE